MGMEGYKIGQTWWSVNGLEIGRIDLLGYVPKREIVFLSFDGEERRMPKDKFKEWELKVFAKRTDAVIERDRLKLELLNSEIELKESELLRLKEERDGING